MEFVVYGDVLVAVNFIINLMILKLCSFFGGVKPKRFTYISGAFVGALCSFVIFLPMQGLFWDICYRIVTALLMVFVTYGRRPWRIFLRLLVVFLVTGFLLAGVVIGLWFLFPTGGYAYHNGVVYFQLKPLTLLLGITAAYLLASGFNRIFRARREDSASCPMVITRGGAVARLEALADTGNHLTEPFSGLPVVVVAFGTAAPLLTSHEQSAILENTLEHDLPPGLRLVSYHTVGGEGLLAAFAPDSISLQVEGHWQTVDAYVAVSKTPLTGDCQAIFNPRIIRLLVT